MSSRKTAAEKNPGSGNRAGMIAILLVVCLLFAVLIFEGSRLKRRIDDNELRRQELVTAIEDEKERTASIESMREYMKSDEYVKQAARDRLGLVESGELIFKPLD